MADAKHIIPFLPTKSVLSIPGIQIASITFQYILFYTLVDLEILKVINIIRVPFNDTS